MKRFFFLPVLLLPIMVMAQNKAASKAGSVSIVKEVIPANLSIVPNSVQFVDATGNQAIDATETCKVVFQVTNTGVGAGYGCVAKITGTGAMNGISLANQRINVIPVNSTQTIEIPIRADVNTVDGQVELTVQVDEPNGFGTDPITLAVNTRAFVAPHLQVMDYTITGTQSATLEKKKPFDLQVLLQNTQYGLAEDVRVTISVPENVYLFGGNQQTNIAQMEAGQTKSLEYSLIVNNNYTGSSIPITFHVQEKHGKYAEDRTIDLAFNATFASAKIAVDEIKQERKEIQMAALTSAVDRNIPKNPTTNNNTFAFIISNENYRTLAPVPCAMNDGDVFAKYCRETLGLPEENVHVNKNMTLNEMRQTVDLLLQIAKYNPQSHIIFYYAGHGAPDESTKEAYLIPIDAYQVNASACYALNDLYGQFKELSNNRVTVFLDACFSGKARSDNDNMLASARGVAIAPKQNTAQGNLVVFSAATGDQTALPYMKEGHGMFTYFLLKILQETKGDVTYAELKQYLETKVPQQSLSANKKLQNPTVNPSAALGSSWQTWTLK